MLFCTFRSSLFYHFRKTSHWSCLFVLFLFVKQHIVSYRNSSDCVNVSWKKHEPDRNYTRLFNLLRYVIIIIDSNRSIGESRRLVWVGLLWGAMKLFLLLPEDMGTSMFIFLFCLVSNVASIYLSFLCFEKQLTIAWFVCYTIILLK